jgi:para-nitrobenzyl esterase
MSKDGIDPNYPVSAETIGINFAPWKGIEGVNAAAALANHGLMR